MTTSTIKIPFKTGSTEQNDAYLGQSGEITIDRTKRSLRVHDGIRRGGEEILRRSDLDEVRNLSVEVQALLGPALTAIGELKVLVPQATTAASTATTARDVTMGYRDLSLTYKNNAEAARTLALQYRDTAKTYQDAALAAKTSAESASSTAVTKAGEASASATAALASKNSAESASSTAVTKAGEASASATAALASKNSAETSANTALKVLAVTSATPPANPYANQEWINSKNGRKYTWVTFNGKSVWAEISTSVLVQTPAGSGSGSGSSPTAQLMGAYSVGETLVAAYPAGTTGTIQFTRTLASSPFTKTAISGAVANAVNSLSYKIQSADMGYVLGVDCSNQVSSASGQVVPMVETAPIIPTVTVLPAQMTVVSGSTSVGNDFDGVSVLRLPNGSSEFAVIPELELGVTYDVFFNWTVSAVPTNLSPVGLVTFVGEFTPWTTGGGTPTGTSRWSGIIPPQAPGVIERSQLPWTLTRNTADDIMRIRLGRRSDNVGGNVQIRSFEYVPTPAPVEATITRAGNVTPTAKNTSLDGNGVLHGFSIYTPIRSSSTALYVVEPMTVGGVQQSRIAKLNKSTYVTLQDVQIGALNHDSVVGHRDGSVVVTDSGKVICYPEGHHAPWAGKIALTEDLTTLAAMAVPTGLDKHCSYRRFFRNPFDGSTWMGARGNDYNAGVWKFNDATNTFDRKPSASMLAGDSGTFLGSYGMELAFGGVDTIYATTEFYQGTTSSTLSGYPRQNLSVIKSIDGGANWTTMRGKAVKTPVVQNSIDDDIAFPTNNRLHNGVYGRLGIGADNQPILVAAWQHPSESTRSLWVAKYDDATKKWVRRRLYKPANGFDVGNPHLAYHNGKVIVSISTTDDHTSGPSSSGGGGERVPAPNNILLFVTTDSAVTWRQYDVNHLAGGYGGAYLDSEAIRLDNKIRMRPVNESAPTTSVVWEMAVPA